MLCKKPFNKNGASYGCGQCLLCRINTRRVWYHRLLLEACCHERASFVTLTYKPEELPDAGEVVPKHLTDWLKRFRSAAGPFRYFAVGEYGDVTQRPHYHVCVFGHGKECEGVVGRTWDYGRPHVLNLSRQLAQYCCGYIPKKLTKVGDERLGGRHPEFVRMSMRPGIGAQAVSTIVQALESTAGREEIARTGDVPRVLRHHGQDLPLGRYMRTLLRERLKFKFRKESPDATFRKTAELLSLWKDHLIAAESSGEAQRTLREFVQGRETVRALQMETRARIYSGAKKI